MKWINLTDLKQLNEIDEQSAASAVMILKHSTRCSISSSALNRIERNWPENAQMNCYYLDLLQHRDISNEIAERYSVRHESPQVLVIKNGKCVYHASHIDINADAVLNASEK